MTQVIELEKVRRAKLTRQAMAAWQRRFGRRFAPDLAAADLPDQVLAELITGEGPGNQALNDFILGARGFSPGRNVEDVDRAEKMVVLESFLVLIDVLRFEAMFRMKWVQDFPDRQRALVDFVGETRVSPVSALEPPAIRETHPEYPAYQNLGDLERPAFLRQTIPAAILAFRRRTGAGL